MNDSLAMTVVLCALLGAVSPGQALQGDVPPTQHCQGSTCKAEYIVFPPAGWTITAESRSGRSVSRESCDNCRSCNAKIYWSYQGEGAWSVLWADGNASGAGAANGSFRRETECDGIPEADKYWADATETQGFLFCPCLH